MSRISLKSTAALAATLCLATVANAQTTSDLTLKPWNPDAFGETNDRPTYQEQGHVKGGEDRAHIFLWDSTGRFRFNRTDPQTPAIGYRWLTMATDSNSALIPDHLDEVSLALGFPLGEIAGGQVSLIGGLGFSGDSPFADDNGVFGIGHVTYDRPIDAKNSLSLSVDYNGNSSFMPDVPLPGIAFVHRYDPASFDVPVSFGVGFPKSWVQWKITDKLVFDAMYEVPFTGDVRLTYHFNENWSVNGGYSNFFNGFQLRNESPTDRLFFQSARVEASLKYTGTYKGMYVDVALTGGYAFEQSFQRGFDARNLDDQATISDEPFIGIYVVGRF